MRWCCLLILLAIVVGQPAMTAGETEDGPMDAVRVALGVEETLMAANLREYQKLILRRDETAARLASLHEALDAAVGDSKSAESGRLDLLIDQVVRVAGERDGLFASERTLLDRISDRGKRIQLLMRRATEFEGREKEYEEKGALTGAWDLILMPVDQRGSAKLKQDGAIEVTLVSYQDDQTTHYVERLDVLEDGALRDQVWLVEGDVRKPMLDIQHKKVAR